MQPDSTKSESGRVALWTRPGPQVQSQMSTQQKALASSKPTTLCWICQLPGVHDNLTECVDAQSRTIKRLLELTADQALYRCCDAPIYWVEHRNGKKVPYTSAGVNHFITCPATAEFKR